MYKLNQFFPYFGAKRRAAKHYAAPRTGLVVEPFAGSAGYSTHYYHPDTRVILVDKYQPVVDAWDFLIKATADDILALPLIGLDEELPNYLPPGPRALIGFWLRRGSATPRTRFSSWASDYPKRFWSAYIRQRIADQVPAIDHWRVVKGSYADVGNAKADWYVDPPYHRAGKTYPESSVDYDHLAEWCRSRKGYVTVCEEEGATWLPFRKAYEHLNVSRKKRTEVVWTNFED